MPPLLFGMLATPILGPILVQSLQMLLFNPPPPLHPVQLDFPGISLILSYLPRRQQLLPSNLLQHRKKGSDLERPFVGINTPCPKRLSNWMNHDHIKIEDNDSRGEDIYPIYQCLESPLNRKCYAIFQPPTALFQLVHIDLEECGYLI